MFAKHIAVGALALAFAAPLAAQTNQGPPANPIFSLTGQPITTIYTQYSFSFNAADPSTNLTFAMRDDPAFIYLDDISMTLTGSATELLVNGGFEDGPVGVSAPNGWTYLNQYGAGAGGTVRSDSAAHTGLNYYYDGAVQAYDAITQVVGTTVGANYTVSFWARESGVSGFYQPLSTNGNTSGTGGNGIDLFVYAQAGAPAPGNTVPEPATWMMMLGGFGLIGAAMRRGTREVTFA